MPRNETIKISATEEDFPRAHDFVEKALGGRLVNASTAYETKLLFEALFLEIASQVGCAGAELEIGTVNRLRHMDIKMTFPGKRFVLPEEDAFFNPDAKVIEIYSERVSCSYQSGLNVIRISVRQSAWAFLLPNLIAIAAAVAAGTVLNLVLDDATRQMVAMEWVAPLENLFTNAVLMIGAPMTLFSLLKNTTDAFIVAERHSSSRRLFMTAMISSLMVVALALVMGFGVAQWALSAVGVTQQQFDLGLANWSLASAVDHIIPSSIIEPFETISPIPMIVVVLLIVGALNSIGQNFDVVKSAVDTCYDLFSGILRIVMAAFPVACFLLFLQILLSNDGVAQFVDIILIVAIVFACALPFLLLYAILLRANGIPVREFVKRLLPLLQENFSIGSVIDAVPCNARYCVKNFGISRDRLEKELPILAQVSLDGNCFILMLLATIYIFIANIEVSVLSIAILAIIVMFLSFGAPNQPGSILIGMLVILTYLNSDIAISLALCFELFCGGLQNILNVISSVTTVAVNECREGKGHLSMS